MRTIEQIKSELLATLAEYEAAQSGLHGLKSADAVQNEGGEGYSCHESRSEDLYNKHMPRISALQRELFAAEWNREVFDQRRAAWNAEMKALSDVGIKMTNVVMQGVVKKLGFTQADLVRAKQMHGVV